MNNFFKICVIALLIGTTILLVAASKGGRGSGRGGRSGQGPGGDPGREQRPPRDQGREGGVPDGNRTIFECPHCKHRLIVISASEQGGRDNGPRGGMGRRQNNGRGPAPRD